MAVRAWRERHEGVERLHVAHAPAGRPVYWTSVYRAGGVVVDTGCAWARREVARFLAERPVEAVLTTHEHEDHVGNHALFRAQAPALGRGLGRARAGAGVREGEGEGEDGPVVWAPARAVEILELGPPRLPFYRWLTWGAHEAAPGVARPAPARVVAAGRPFVAQPTPGHSAEHVAWLDEEASAVFAGDAYFARLRAVRAKEDVPLQMASLRRLAELDPATLYPTHGPVVARPRAALLETADRFDRLAERARALAERGLSARRIRQDLFGPEPAITWFSWGAFSAENLVRSLLRAPR